MSKPDHLKIRQFVNEYLQKHEGDTRKMRELAKAIIEIEADSTRLDLKKRILDNG